MRIGVRAFGVFGRTGTLARIVGRVCIGVRACSAFGGALRSGAIGLALAFGGAWSGIITARLHILDCMERRRGLRYALGAACIISAVFYLTAEAIAVSACKTPQTAYFTHTISELGIPVNCAEGGGFSPLYALMNAALICSGAAYIPCYCACFNKFDSKIKRVICRILATLTGLGVMTVGIFHGGNPAVFGVHGAGAATCFSCGNALAIYTGIYYKGEGFAAFSKAAIIIGSLGLIGAVFTFVLSFSPLAKFAGIPERIAVYSIILWLFLSGIYTIFATRRKPLPKKIQTV
ncbi:MAG: hypothetical protein ACI4MH_00050 [Candidatus Coproplasma sp.]